MKHLKRIRDRVDSGFSEIKVKTTAGRKFKPDSRGFFVIHVDNVRKRIVVEHYSYDRKIKSRIAGSRAKDLCGTLISRGLVSTLEHATYIGRELIKAEIALENNLKYRQDRRIKF